MLPALSASFAIISIIPKVYCKNKSLFNLEQAFYIKTDISALKDDDFRELGQKNSMRIRIRQ
jgi:hypothetical protein